MTIKRYILDEIDLHEISGVDDPAQPTAKATIIKRNSKTEAEAGPSGIINKSEEEKSLTPEEIEKKVADAVEANTTELTKSFDEKLAEAINAAYDTMFALDSDEHSVLKAKTKEEQDELMKLTPEERKKKLKAEKEADEVVKFEGKEIAKSVVGADTFAIYKKFEAMEAEVAKAKEAETFAKLEKRASEEFGNLPGTDVEKASILKALTSLDAEVAKNLEAILKSANEANAEAFVEKGAKTAVDKDDVVAKKAAFDTKVEDIMKSRSVNKTRAYEIVAAENPELI